jgi:5-hydroxyisourate hydrolase-like protein (transthyretin family)
MIRISNLSLIFLLLGTILLVPGCLLVDDESLNTSCNSDCTTIQGKFTTEDGKSIANVSLELDWSKFVMLGGNVRKIMTGKTDENGEYKFVFHAKDNELINGAYSVKFKLPDNSFITHESYEYYEFGIDKRDTVVIANYHVPKKGGKINLKIKNPDIITGEDKIISSVSYKLI